MNHTKDNLSKRSEVNTNSSLVKSGSSELVDNRSVPVQLTFDQPVLLRQSPIWSRLIVWTMMIATVSGITWATFAKIEQVVPAMGQLKPKETVKEIQAPVNGVVKHIGVKDGDKVKQGQLLLVFDPTTVVAELNSLQIQRQALIQEINFYRTVLGRPIIGVNGQPRLVSIQLSDAVQSLARNRIALMEQNQLYIAQLNGSNGVGLRPEQQAQLQASRNELASRSNSVYFEMQQLGQQLNQNQQKLQDARDRLMTERRLLIEMNNRNKLAFDNAKERLETEQKIFDDLKPLYEKGGIAKLQYSRQNQEVNNRQAEVESAESKLRMENQAQEQKIGSIQAEISQLIEEDRRLRLHVNQIQQKYKNTGDSYQKNVLDLMGENQKRIAEIDSQMTKNMVENEKKLAEIDSQISRNQVNFKYQQVYAPVSGTVFDMQPKHQGYVVDPSKVLLKIIPNDNLVADVYVTNKDIGFVKTGQRVDVRIDSFPFSEFGDIDGTIESIGDDSLPPDEVNKFYRFPVRIKLDSQKLKVGDRRITLQSGMSVTANIRIREDRTVLNLLTEMFTNSLDRLRGLR